jgi:hypothetical protein
MQAGGWECEQARGEAGSIAAHLGDEGLQAAARFAGAFRHRPRHIHVPAAVVCSSCRWVPAARWRHAQHLPQEGRLQHRLHNVRLLGILPAAAAGAAAAEVPVSFQ